MSDNPKTFALCSAIFQLPSPLRSEIPESALEENMEEENEEATEKMGTLDEAVTEEEVRRVGEENESCQDEGKTGEETDDKEGDMKSNKDDEETGAAKGEGLMEEPGKIMSEGEKVAGVVETLSKFEGIEHTLSSLRLSLKLSLTS